MPRYPTEEEYQGVEDAADLLSGGHTLPDDEIPLPDDLSLPPVPEPPNVPRAVALPPLLSTLPLALAPLEDDLPGTVAQGLGARIAGMMSK